MDKVIRSHSHLKVYINESPPGVPRDYFQNNIKSITKVWFFQMMKLIIPLTRISLLLSKQDEYLIVTKSLLFTNFPTPKLLSKPIRTVLSSELSLMTLEQCCGLKPGSHHFQVAGFCSLCCQMWCFSYECYDYEESGNVVVIESWDTILKSWHHHCCLEIKITVITCMRPSHAWANWNSFIGVIEEPREPCQGLQPFSPSCATPFKPHVPLP